MKGVESGLKGLLGQKKEGGGLSEKFGKLFLLGAVTKTGPKNEEASNNSGFRRAPAHIPKEEIKVVRE